MAERKRRRRHWPIWVVLVVAVVVGGTYERLTSPARLRAAALRALQTLPFDGIDIGHVTFSLPGQLELTDVVVEAQHAPPPAEPPAGVRAPPLLRVGQMRIDCALVDLLLGRLRPTRLVLQQVGMAAVCYPESLEDEAAGQRVGADARLLWKWLQAAGDELPPVTVEQADLQVFVVEGGALQLVQRMLLRAAGVATPNGYDLRIDHRPAKDAPLAELHWDRPAGEGTLALDWVDLKAMARLLPPRAAEIIAHIGLAGRVRLERLAVHLPPVSQEVGQSGAALGRLELQLADLRCALPLEEEEMGLAGPGQRSSPAGCFLQLTNGAGRLTYRPTSAGVPSECEVRLQGRLRGAPTALQLRMRSAPLHGWWTARSAARDEDTASAFDLDDLLQAELRADGLDLPTAETYPAFVRSHHLTGPVVAALRDYRPRGKVNLRLRVQPPDATDEDGVPLAGPARIAGEIEGLGAACRYVHFPYDFADVWGTLRLARGRILLDQLTGRHGIGRVRANGVIHSSRSWSGFELQFHGQNVALDADLYAALPESYRQLWQQASPLGLCDTLATVRRPDGTAETGPAAADVQVQARLLSGSLALGDGRRLDHADGSLVIHAGRAQVENLHGYDGSAGVRLDGEIRTVEGKTRADLRVEVSDLPIEHTAPLTAGAADAPSQVSFTGHADVWGHVYDSSASGQRRELLAVHVKDGELVGLDATRPWSVRDGWIRAHDGSRQVLSLTCAQDQSRLELSGVLPAASSPAGALTLDVHAQTGAVEDLYPQFVPARWSARIAELGLTGSADLTVNLHPAETGPMAGQQVVAIALRAAQMRPPPLPLDLRNITAELTLAPGRFHLTQAAADWGPQGHIDVRQADDGLWQAGQLEAEFDIAAQRMRLGPDLVRALPGAAPQLLEKLAPQGEFDALLSRVQVTGGTQRTWRIEGRVLLREVALQLGLDLAIAEGELSGVCAVLPDGDVELDGSFGVARGQLAGRPIERWEGVIQREAGGRWLRLEDVHGRVCDGVAQATLRIDPRTSDYELAVDLRDVSIDQMLPPPKMHPEHPRRGRIDGEVWLRGTGNDPTNRRGGGDLLVSGASFVQSPVLASVLRLRTPPASDVVDRARVRFRWEGREILLDHITIESADLRLVGTGTWNMRDDAVRMTLWAARPELWPRIEGLNKVLELAGQELVQYRVEGTLATPRVTALPLHRITEALRGLLKQETSR